jgi:hypothetical protein
VEHDEEMHPGLHAAATELMSAIKRNDAKGVAMAFESAFQILELGEHEEHEHEEEEAGTEEEEG